LMRPFQRPTSLLSVQPCAAQCSERAAVIVFGDGGTACMLAVESLRLPLGDSDVILTGRFKR
jgi:hypothetical protein